MRILVKSSALRTTQRVLFAAAILLLGYCGYVLVDAWIFQNQENAALQRFVPDRVPAVAVATSPESLPAIGPDGLIGRIDILRLGVSVIVVEGTAHKTFRRAAGHIPGTAFPGQRGNIGIAGHRDTFFRPLRNIQQDDLITLMTPRGQYDYRVVSTRIVQPEDVAVLDSDGNEVLTLVTCYPFYFLGSAPQRFIVRATRVI